LAHSNQLLAEYHGDDDIVENNELQNETFILIILNDVDDYLAWKSTTKRLMLDKPATRDEAKEAFRETIGYERY